MNQKHTDLDSLTGYIYRTLDDATRESIDTHLLSCPICRGRLSEQEMRHRQISNELSGVINQAIPSGEMVFSTIAPKLKSPRATLNFWPRLSDSTPITLALTGLCLALLGLWKLATIPPMAMASQQAGMFPTLACFFFVLASVEQYDRALSIQPRFVITSLVAIILWLGSAMIGLLDLIVIRDLAIMAVAAVDGTGAQAGPIAIIAVYLGVMVYIGVVIGGAEYHFKHIGQPSSWKLFSITLLGQLFLLILPYLMM
jgi:hypothetical protein